MSMKPGDYVVVVDAADSMENGQLIRIRDVDGYGRFHLYGFDGPWNPERFKAAPSYQELAERVKTLEAERAEVLEKLKLALPHIAHELSCCQINSARDWATKGSVTTEGCACDRKAITTLIAKLEGTQGA